MANAVAKRSSDVGQPQPALPPLLPEVSAAALAVLQAATAAHVSPLTASRPPLSILGAAQNGRSTGPVNDINFPAAPARAPSVPQSLAIAEGAHAPPKHGTTGTHDSDGAAEDGGRMGAVDTTGEEANENSDIRGLSSRRDGGNGGTDHMVRQNTAPVVSLRSAMASSVDAAGGAEGGPLVTTSIDNKSMLAGTAANKSMSTVGDCSDRAVSSVPADGAETATAGQEDAPKTRGAAKAPAKQQQWLRDWRERLQRAVWLTGVPVSDVPGVLECDTSTMGEMGCICRLWKPLYTLPASVLHTFPMAQRGITSSGAGTVRIPIASLDPAPVYGPARVMMPGGHTATEEQLEADFRQRFCRFIKDAAPNQDGEYTIRIAVLKRLRPVTDSPLAEYCRVSPGKDLMSYVLRIPGVTHNTSRIYYRPPSAGLAAPASASEKKNNRP